MSRSMKKWLAVDYSLLKKIQELDSSPDGGKSAKPINVARSHVIVPNFVGRRFLVHNGKQHIPVLVNDEMVGSKFGEFAATRKFPTHPTDKSATRRGK